MELKDFYLEGNDIWGFPQKFKGLDFYPVKLKNNYLETVIRHVLYHNKKEFISKLEEQNKYDSIQYVYRSKYLKSYLMTIFEMDILSFKNELNFIRYLIVKVCRLEELYEGEFDIRILSDKKYENIEEMYNSNFYIGITIKEKEEIVINEEDFELIRELILKQNDMSLKAIEDYNKEMENKLYAQLKELGSSFFSDEMFGFLSIAKMNINDSGLQEYTLYQFNRHSYFAKQLKEYELNYPLFANGLIKNKNTIKHYATAYHERGRYDSLLMSQKDFEKSQISEATGGIKLNRDSGNKGSDENYDEKNKQIFKNKINAKL